MHTERHRRYTGQITVIAALTLLACGDSPTEPPPFPAVSGTFEIDVDFTDLSSSVARASGTIVLEQPSRQSGELGGSADVVVVILAPATRITEIRAPSVTEDKRISFELPPENPTSTWLFRGSVSADGTRLGGIHVLSGAQGGSLTGSWRATRR
jgi:hypothetical protein